MEQKQRFADSFGAAYDIFHEAVPWHDNFQNSIVKELAKHFKNNPTPILFEAGFGTGITMKKVLEAFPGAFITAVDNVPGMADKTRQYIGNSKLNNVELKIDDVLEVLQTLPANSIDGFYSGYVLHNIPHEQRAEIIKHIYRILKPGAIYVNGDRIALDDNKAQQQALAQAIINCSIFFSKYNDPEYYLDWVRHYLRDEEPDLIFKAADQQRILNDVGFSYIEYVFQHDLEQTCKAIK